MFQLRGILFKLIALFLFTIMASLIKASGNGIPAGEAVFFRSLFAMPVIVAWLALRGDLGVGLKMNNPLGHLWRGLIGGCAMGMGFSALRLLPLPEVTAIGFAAPLFTVILAAVLLGERVRAFRISMVLLGLVGVAIILAPRLSAGGNYDRLAMIGIALTLGSAAFRALAQIQIRRLVQSEETAAIVFYFSLTTTLLSLLTAPFGWIVPPWETTAMLIAAGLLGGVAQIFLTASYRFATASLLAPFDYTSILFATAFGYVVFDEIPTQATLYGSAVVIFAGILIIWRERQLGLKRGKARPTLSPQG